MGRIGKVLTLAGGLAFLASGASAQTFDGGIPSGWSCLGTCGATGANGVVTLAPGGGTQYGYVTTAGSSASASLSGVGGTGSATNGSMLRSSAFAVNAGEALEFYFNYVTSDGAGYADYAWARLLHAGSLTEAAILFTARTHPTNPIVPGTAMPDPAATLNPASATIQAGTTWAALGGSSGSCYAAGCGHSGWIFSQFVIGAGGNYILEFGVTNWNDTAYQSGMAFDGLMVGGQPFVPVDPTVVPEPMTMALLGTGLAGIAAARRRRRQEDGE
jgi:hypothetical protein